MKKSIIYLTTILFAAFMFWACEDTSTNPDDNNTPTPKPAAPTKLMATSKNSTSVILKWTASTSESDALFAGYVLKVTGGATMAPISIAKGQTTYTVTGLEEGIEYTFSLQAKFTNNELSDAITIKWSPASRFETNENDAEIRIYETASGFGSGVQLYGPNKKPVTLKVADGARWTLGLSTKTGILFGSPKELDYSYGSTPVAATEIADVITGINSLDEIFDSQALNAKTFASKVIDLTKYNGNIAFALRYKQQGQTEWNYAKVFVKYGTGSFLQGSTPNRYITIIVSHQVKTGLPYAITREVEQTNNNIK